MTSSEIKKKCQQYLIYLGMEIKFGYKIVRQWPGRPGFNTRLSHTKDSKNGT